MIKAEQLANFDTYIKGYNGSSYKVSCLAPYIYSICPNNISTDGNSSTVEFKLGISALIHGDEVLGFYILEDFVTSILENQRRLNFPLLIVLGNTEAALKGLRFVEYDLNRSFDKTSDDKLEFRRAQQIMPFVSRSENWIDLHQCIYPTLESFFIFKYSKKSLIFAGALDEKLAIVTYKDVFSKDGKTLMGCLPSDAFVTTIELGQKGFSNELKNHGLRILQKALSFLQRPSDTYSGKNEIYTWGHVEKQEESLKELVPGLQNFSVVQKGELLCTQKGKEVLSPVTGKVLFPKYGEVAKVSAEVCRLMVPTTPQKLDQSP